MYRSLFLIDRKMLVTQGEAKAKRWLCFFIEDYLGWLDIRVVIYPRFF